MIRVVIVDDHELFRLGIIKAIENRHPDLQVVGEAETGVELFRILEGVAVDIVLLDIDLPDMTGVEVARRLKKERPEVKILVVSSIKTASVLQEMIDAGVEGFISKRYGGVDMFAEAVRSISSGFEYFGQDISDIIHQIYMAKKRSREVTPEFTPQERRIIELCSQGLPAKLIADRLNIGTRSVENHKYNIFRKLGITNSMEMVQYALHNGIIHL